MNRIVLHDCKGREILICAESIEVLTTLNNGGGVFVYLEDCEKPIKAFGMSQVVKAVEDALGVNLLKSKGWHYNNTIACEYDYLVPDKIKHVMPYNQDGYASKITVSSGRCWLAQDTVEELHEQLDNISVVK